MLLRSEVHLPRHQFALLLLVFSHHVNTAISSQVQTASSKSYIDAQQQRSLSQASTISSSTAAGQQHPAFQIRNLQRCRGVRGSHCTGYYTQQYVPLQAPKVHSKPCPNNCTDRGVCNGDTGLCDCPAGVGGPDCSSADVRPCTNQYRTDRNSTTPASHIGPNKRDVNWTAPGLTQSRCAGVCDDATGICYCDGPHFGRVPAPEGSPAGSPPIRPGRLLHGNCQRLKTDDKGQQLSWGAKGMSYDDIYGAQGWCTVDTPRVRCSCDMDGVDGELCEVTTETVCPNHCSGHGECFRGFCMCFAGWYGLDCARLSNADALEAPGAQSTGSLDVDSAQQDLSVGDGGTNSQKALLQNDSDDDALNDADTANEAGNVAAVAEVALQTGGAVDVAKTAANADAAERIAAAAAAATAALPEHVRFMFERPYLADLVVDTWTQTSNSVDAAAAALSVTDSSTASTTTAAQQKNVLQNLAAHGGLSIAAAEVQVPPIPDIYFKPLHEADTETSDEADIPDDPEQAIPAKRRRQRHLNAANVTDAALNQVMAAASAKQVQQATAAASQRATQDNLQPAPASTSSKQQQQKPHTNAQHKPSRQLLRHMWTGGGGRRDMISIAPTQAAVTSAVQLWLSGKAPGSSTGSTFNANAAALQEALSAAGVQMEQLHSVADVELLQHMVEQGLADVPIGKARRPRIFVYDMPSRFVGRMLQYRPSKQTCTWRIFSKSNFSLYTTTESDNAWRYPLESHLHELMLQSPHRTLNPEEADFFYVPVYASCFMEAVAGWADAPWWHVQSRSMVKQGVGMYMDALNWIRTTYPYWNATKGANHIWLFAHDEGACWAPAEIYNNSVILSQWGRLPVSADDLSRPGGMVNSSTSRWDYNFNKGDDKDDPHMPGGYLQHIGTHACYTPGKDLILPGFKPPPRYHASPFLGGDNRQVRDILLLLRTDMGATRPASFSQGIRQQLAKLVVEGKWKQQHRIWIGTEKELEGDYSVLLSRSRYCLVVPRDGWSGLFEDAVLHGCIPVVVSGGSIGSLAQPFSALLKLSSAVLKIRTEEVPQLPAILAGITGAQEQALRRQLYRFWHRFAWLSHPWVIKQAEGLVATNLQKHPWVKDELAEQVIMQKQAFSQMGRQANGTVNSTASAAQQPGLFDVKVWQPGAAVDDAFSTLLQWLHYKLLRPYDAAAAAARAKQRARWSGKDAAVTVERKRKHKHKHKQ